jgi:hypothetical protein
MPAQRRPLWSSPAGLVQIRKTGDYAVLSDILGDEDHSARHMDFKVTGTEKRHLRLPDGTSKKNQA